MRGTFTLFAEVEERGQLPALVVASQHVDGLGVGNFEGHHHCHYFNWEIASVNVVPQEQVRGLVGIATHFGLQQLE